MLIFIINRIIRYVLFKVLKTAMYKRYKNNKLLLLLLLLLDITAETGLYPSSATYTVFANEYFY